MRLLTQTPTTTTTTSSSLGPHLLREDREECQGRQLIRDQPGRSLLSRLLGWDHWTLEKAELIRAMMEVSRSTTHLPVKMMVYGQAIRPPSTPTPLSRR